MAKNYAKMMIVMIIMVIGITTCNAQYYRHRPVRGYYHRPYYGYYYTPRVVYNVGGYYSAYPQTVVVERPVYTTTTRTTTTTTKTKSTSFEGDGVKVERLGGKLFRVKGEKSESTLTTENANFRIITTKKGSVTIQTNGKDDVIDVKVLHGDQVVQQSQL